MMSADGSAPAGPPGRDGPSSTRDWPAWATETVEIRPPNPSWQRHGERECRLVDSALDGELAAGVEHVGSTAVPGLAAKPILDLQAAVEDVSGAGRIAAALTPDGWHLVPPELDGRQGRLLFVKVVAGRRAAHLHLTTAEDPSRQHRRTFRDALRADPALAQTYADLKRFLAGQHADDREAYTAAKSDFIDAVVNAVAGQPPPAPQ